MEQGVELRGARGDTLDVLAPLQDRHARLKALTLDFLSDLVALVRFGLRDALDVEHLLLRANPKVKVKIG